MSRSSYQARDPRFSGPGPPSSSLDHSGVPSTSRGIAASGGGSMDFSRYPTQSVNQKAALASAYNELGKELGSTRLKVIGNYTLGRTIGQGTFGKVRLGTHRLTGTRVAIKQIPKAHSASLTREIHHHRRLHHAHVMRLYEVLATESNIWMISELCSGGELYDYLVERGTLIEPEARRVFGQLCLAVSYVHGRGIVHRDLKLENVLLDERCNVKLGDFGFTREYEGKRLMETFCGTTGYAAPEMLAGKKYTGQEVDIWSLGIILYALLCGSLPFDDDDEHIMKAKILQGKFELPETLSEEARDLVSNILRQEPTERLSIRAILGHPWFAKIMTSNSMETVDEHESTGIASYTRQEKPHRIQRTPSRPVSPRSSVTPLPTLNKGLPSGETTRREADVAPSAESSTTTMTKDASQSASSLLDHESAGDQLTSDSSDVSEDRSGVSGLTAPTSVEDTSGSRFASQTDEALKSQADKAAVRDRRTVGKYVDIDPEHLQQRPIGMQHRNESQSTIRRNGSSGSEGGVSRQSIHKGVKSGNGAGSLPTHHESPGGSGSGVSIQAGEDEEDEDPSSLQQYTEFHHGRDTVSSAPHLSVKDSTSPIRSALHRTPSRTKRRSVSSAGLSDHHPPAIDQNRPTDYLSLLEASQPALFSSPLEQELLHQLSNLGLDVGQIVHSILTDACDASAAMWWLLRRKAEERKEVEKYVLSTVGTSPMLNTTERMSSENQVSTAAQPAERQKVQPTLKKSPQFGPHEDLPSSVDTAIPTGLISHDSNRWRSDGLPASAQESFRRQKISSNPDEPKNQSTPFAFVHSSPPSAPSGSTERGASQHHPQRHVIRSPEPIQSSLKTLLPAPSPSRPAIQARSSSAIPAGTVASSPRGKACSTAGISESPGSPNGGRRPQAGRQRASSLGLKLSNALSSSSKKDQATGNEPEPPVPPVTAGTDKNKGVGLTSGLGLFNRRASGGAKKMKVVGGARDQLGTAPIDFSNEDLSSKDGALSNKMRQEGPERLQTSTPPSKSSSALTDRSGSPTSSKQLATSNSEDTFSTVYSVPTSSSTDRRSSVPDGVDGSEQSAESSSKNGKAKNKGRSSFLTTVRTWLGTEEKINSGAGTSGVTTRRKKKGNVSKSLGHHQDASGAESSGRAYPGGGGGAGGTLRSSTVRSRTGQYPAGGSVARRGSKRSPASSRTLQMPRGASISRPPSSHGHLQPHTQDGPVSPLLGQGVQSASSPYSSTLVRPPYYRRQSAGSITPTGTLYGGFAGGERPSRAPSNSSLYRTPLATGQGLHGRRGSSSSAHSTNLRRQQTSSSGFPQGSLGPANSGGMARAPYSPATDRAGGGGGGEAGDSLSRALSRRSIDSGTIVRRQRGSVHRPRSETYHSRPSSIMENPMDREPDLLEKEENERDSAGGELSIGGGGGGGGGLSSPGITTPRRPSLESNSRRENDSSHGHGQGYGAGRASPTVFLAHRTRQSYKPPSANPSLFLNAGSGFGSRSPSLSRKNSEILSPATGSNPASHPHESSGPRSHTPQAFPLAGSGTWRRSWGRPPPSWAGPVDSGPSHSEVSAAARAAAHARSTSSHVAPHNIGGHSHGGHGGATGGGAVGGGRMIGLRDVFAEKDDEDWEDEDDVDDCDGGTFSGGLGQLDSNRFLQQNNTMALGFGGRGQGQRQGQGHFSGSGSGSGSGTAGSAWSSGGGGRAMDSPIRGARYGPSSSSSTTFSGVGVGGTYPGYRGSHANPTIESQLRGVGMRRNDSGPFVGGGSIGNASNAIGGSGSKFGSAFGSGSGSGGGPTGLGLGMTGQGYKFMSNTLNVASSLPSTSTSTSSSRTISAAAAGGGGGAGAGAGGSLDSSSTGTSNSLLGSHSRYAALRHPTGSGQFNLHVHANNNLSGHGHTAGGVGGSGAGGGGGGGAGGGGFVPPLLGREIRPRMIAVCEDEDGDEDEDLDLDDGRGVGVGVGVGVTGGEDNGRSEGKKISLEELNVERDGEGGGEGEADRGADADGEVSSPQTGSMGHGQDLTTTPATASGTATGTTGSGVGPPPPPPPTITTNTPTTNTSGSTSTGTSGPSTSSSSRIGGSIPPSFRSNIVEEEEEEEE